MGDYERLVQCSYAVMLADGEVSPKEMVRLNKMSERRNIPPERLQQLLHEVRSEGNVQPPPSDEGNHDQAFLRGLVQMCLADGVITGAEKQLIKSLVKHMRYVDMDVNQMIRSERARLYQESKALIRDAS